MIKCLTTGTNNETLKTIPPYQSLSGTQRTLRALFFLLVFNSIIASNLLLGGSIGDFVWEDLNKNGLQELDEPGIANIEILLFNNRRTLVTSVRTDSLGYYSFSNLDSGYYYLQLGQHGEYLPTVSSYEFIDRNSDIDVLFLKTSILYVNNDFINNIDIGLYRLEEKIELSTIGDFVWEDLNKNGLQELDEPGIADIEILLFNNRRTLVASVYTDSLGYYSFSNLDSGYYYLQLGQHGDYLPTVSSYEFIDRNSDIDVLFLKTSILYVNNHDTINHIDIGLYRLEEKIGLSTIGDFVWEDLNKNGLQELDEPGIADIEILLFNNRRTLVASVYTDSLGYYSFSNLDSGYYYLQLGQHGEYLPTVSSYEFIDRNSDIDLLFLKTSILYVNNHDTINHIDIGLYRLEEKIELSTIGDFVWNDKNHNGYQEEGEPGISGIELTLYDNSRTKVMTTVSDELGYYLFDSIPSGLYYVQLNDLSGYLPTFSTYDQPEINSDLDILFLKTSIIILDSGEDKKDIDIGLFSPISIEGQIWDDAIVDCVKEEFELFMPDMDISLFDENKFFIKSTKTDNEGRFKFSKIIEGNYYLEIHTGLNKEICLSGDNEISVEELGERLIVGPIKIVDSLIYDNLQLAIETLHPCEWEIEILEYNMPSCGSNDGFIIIDVTDFERNYEIKWDNGQIGHLNNDLSAGVYNVSVSDEFGCTRQKSISLEYLAEQCDELKHTVNIDLKVLLEGPYDLETGLMTSSLYENGYLPGMIPTTIFGNETVPGQPFQDQPWEYQGLEGNYNGDFRDFYPFHSVDWVLVSLRTDISKESEIYKRAGILTDNGNIQFVDGYDQAYIDTSNQYYVVIEHRNHMIVMSPYPISIIDKTISFDFTNNQSYKSLLGHGQKLMSDGQFAMFAGNIHHDDNGYIDLNYKDLKSFYIENGRHSSYYISDIDMNGDVNVRDRQMIQLNVGVFVDVPY